MSFDMNRPIYVQLAEVFRKKILAGEWKKDEKIPSVREIAIDYGINPNTVQKALKVLEEEGLIYAKRTLGKFVGQDAKTREKLKEDYAKEITKKVIKQYQEIELSREDALEMIFSMWEEKGGND